MRRKQDLVSRVRRAQFWYEVRLFLLVSAIVIIPFGLAVWVILEWF